MTEVDTTICGCQKCGACCRRLIIEITHLDVVREPRLLEVATLMDADLGHESDWDKEYHLPVPCGFLVDNQCSIYPTRPNVCVAFDPDGDEREQHLSCRDIRVSPGSI